MSSLSLAAVDWSIVALVPTVAFVLGRTAKRYHPTDYVDYFLARRSLGAGRFIAALVGSNLTFTTIFLVLSQETALRGWWVASAPPLAFFLGLSFSPACIPAWSPTWSAGSRSTRRSGRPSRPEERVGRA
jgi:Na+/proline symporter